MMDFGKLTELLHLREKLAGHPNLAPLMAHVDVELHNLAAEATKTDLPKKLLTKQQEETRVAMEEAAKVQAKADADAKAAEQATKANEEEIAARRKRDEEMAKGPVPIPPTAQPADAPQPRAD